MITAARERIRPKLSVREAARRAGISEGWWRQIVNGWQPVSGGGGAPVRGPAPTVARMAQIVGVTPEELATTGERPDAAEELRILLSGPSGPTTSELFSRAYELLAELRQELDVRLGEDGRRQREAALTILEAELAEKAEKARKTEEPQPSGHDV